MLVHWQADAGLSERQKPKPPPAPLEKLEIWKTDFYAGAVCDAFSLSASGV